MSKTFFKMASENKLIFLLLLSTIILRFFLPYMSFASSDLSNLMNKYLYLKNEIDFNDIPNVTLAIPRFPFVVNLFNFAGVISDYINLNMAFFIKYLAVIFELAIAVLLLKIYKLETKFENSNKFYLLFLLLIIINPLAIYVNSFLGFFETLWIFFLLLTVYVYEYEKKEIKSFYIPIFLAISISIKPVSIIFLIYFYFKSDTKSQFIVLFIISILLLNAYFILGAINNPIKIYNLFETVTSALLIGNQTGEFGMSEIEKLYVISNGSYNFTLFKLIKLIEILVYAYIYLKLINSSKVKSYEFIFLIFLITIFFNDNLHANYLYWIIPFGVIINYKKTLIFSIVMCAIVLESETRHSFQILIFNYLNIFDFFQDVNQLETRVYTPIQIFLKITLFYTALLVFFEKKLLKKIFKPNFKILNNVKQIIPIFFIFGKLKINLDRKIIFNKYSLILAPIIFIIFFNHNFLTNIISKSDYDFNNLAEPVSIKKFYSHGNNIEYKTNIQISDTSKNHEIIFLTGYYSSIYINEKKVLSERNIIHFIEDRYKHENFLERYPLKKININKYIKLGKNEITILSNNPHSIKKFGLIFNLFIDKQINKKLIDFKWAVKINKIVTDFKVTNFDDNTYVKKYTMIFENYKEMQILKLKNNSSLRLLNPHTFLIYIFVLISLFNLFILFKLSNFRVKS
jgi:hypothetical protein